MIELYNRPATPVSSVHENGMKIGPLRYRDIVHLDYYAR